MLVVIGKWWLAIRDARGRVRLEQPNDFVRIEITAALRRGIPVVPVLVAGADMPGEEDLPEGLKELARRQAVDISRNHEAADLDRLVSALERRVGALPR
jgi:hypothetical protein